MTKQDAINSDDFLNNINEHLENYETERLLNYFKANSNDEILDKLSWTLVPTIAGYLTQENLSIRPNFFNICEELLIIFAEKCNPAETVLLFLEQIESLPDDIRFVSLLKPLGTSLRSGDLSKSIEWVVSSIRAYAEDLPLPENLMPAGKNPKNCVDPVVDRLTKTYESILNFLSPLIDNHLNKNPHDLRTRTNFLNLYLNLFGKPFALIDTEPQNDSSIFTSAVLQMLRLESDPFKFLRIIDDRRHKRVNELNQGTESRDTEYNIELQLLDHEVNDLAYANFYFILLSSDSLNRGLPQIYHPHYVMNCSFYLANYLLKKPEYVLVSKGLRFVDEVLKRIDDESIEQEALGSTIHEDLFAGISQVMIYCDSENERQMALRLFNNYVGKFGMRARYRIIWQLYETSNHSGLLAVVINLLKTAIMQALERREFGYFLGNKLAAILRRIYRLPNGRASDLVELSDEIIAGLNLLRFLVIRDKVNETGVWNLVDELRNDYLKELREGIDLARAHWKVKIKDLEEEKRRFGDDFRRAEAVTVTVGGENLPDLPVGEKIRFCYQAINALDVMESISIRVNECMDCNPIKRSSNL